MLVGVASRSRGQIGATRQIARTRGRVLKGQGATSPRGYVPRRARAAASPGGHVPQRQGAAAPCSDAPRRENILPCVLRVSV